MVPYTYVHPINPMRFNTNTPIESKRYQRSPGQWFECSNNGIYAIKSKWMLDVTQALSFVFSMQQNRLRVRLDETYAEREGGARKLAMLWREVSSGISTFKS